MACIKGGWVGQSGGGWEAKGRLQFPLGYTTGSSAVFSVRDINRHDIQDRQR